MNRLLRFSHGCLPWTTLAIFLAGAGCRGAVVKADAEAGITPCSGDLDCSDDSTFVCIAGACRLNTCTPDAGCANGEQCDPLHLVCYAESGSGLDGGSACGTKYDCSFGEACVDGQCGTPPAICAIQSQCARGQYCNAISDQCVAGCSGDADCVSPDTCSAASVCVTPCGPAMPCADGQLCANNGTCEGAPSCVMSASCDGTSTGSICQTKGICGPCSATSDCAGPPYGPGYTCVSGACVLGCNSDADCAGDGNGPSGNPLCDVGTGQCVQCIVPSDCGDAGASCVNNTCTTTSPGSCLPIGDMTTCVAYCLILQGVCDAVGDCCTM